MTRGTSRSDRPTIRFLTPDDKQSIYDTFVSSFADYHLNMSYMTPEVLFYRAEKNGIRYDLSAAAFDNGKMVGITLIGAGNWNGSLAAFDCGTGIVPEYRNRGIAGQMLTQICTKLKAEGIKRLLLEVLKVNEAGQRAYLKSGFKISRSFEGLKISVPEYKAGLENRDIRVIEGERLLIGPYESLLDWPPSWENSTDAIRRIPDDVKLYSAEYQGNSVGILVYYPLLKWIMLLHVKRSFRKKHIASSLLNHLFNDIGSEETEIKCVNIEATDIALLSLLKKRGFYNYADQYEMERILI